MTILGPDGEPLPNKKNILDPDDVAMRIKKRETREYEDASKALIRYAAFGIKKKWPKNLTDDLQDCALLLAEIYVAKREGIIKGA